jgi:hypothetical protein
MHIYCPYCSAKCEILFGQYSSGEPDGTRFVAHHDRDIHIFIPPNLLSRMTGKILCAGAGAQIMSVVEVFTPPGSGILTKTPKRKRK